MQLNTKCLLAAVGLAAMVLTHRPISAEIEIIPGPSDPAYSAAISDPWVLPGDLDLNGSSLSVDNGSAPDLGGSLWPDGTPVGGTVSPVFTFNNANVDGNLDPTITGTTGNIIGSVESFAASSSEVLLTPGVAAPGSGGGAFAAFGDPSLNDAGEIAFFGGLTGTTQGSANDVGIFVVNSDAITEIMREGQDTGNGTFLTPNSGDIAITNGGQVVFSSLLANTAGSDDNFGYFIGDGSSTPADVIRGGEPVPGTGEPIDALFLGYPRNQLGQIGFAFFGDDSAPLLRAGPGGLEVIATTGDAAPNGTGVYDSFSDPSINNNGDLAADAFLSGPNGRGLYRFDDDGGVTEIFVSGDAAPDGNGTFAATNNTRINDIGQVAYAAFFQGTTGGADDDFGIYISDGAAPPVKVVREGDLAPDGNGAHADLFTEFAFNDAGQVAFIGTLTGPTITSANDRGVFLGDTAAFEQIVREGDPVPVGSGVFNVFGDLALNDAGQLAFTAGLGNTDSGVDDDGALYFFDPVAGLIEIAREGDAVLGSTIREIDLIGSTGDLGETRSGLNNAGQVAYKVLLIDNRQALMLGSPFGDGETIFHDGFE